MRLHDEILTVRQKTALNILGPRTLEKDFYLAGGTAVALHLGHRRSVDFDWFRESPLLEPLRLAEELREEGVPLETGQIARGTLYGSIRGVRISFFEFRYPLLDPPLLWPEYRCRLAGLRDLACMKLSAIAQRGSRKDFIDLYALLQAGFALPEILDWYRQKFAVEDIGHLLYALAYFDDADAERMPRMLWKVSWKDVKRTLQGWFTSGRNL